MTAELVLLLLAPFAAAVGTQLVPRPVRAIQVAGLGALVSLLLALDLARRVLSGAPPPTLFGTFRVDALAAPFAVLVALVAVLAEVVALSHYEHESRAGEARNWALLSSLFNGALLGVVVCDHLGVLWIAMESSALLGAVLIGSHGGARAARAAVKYVLLGGAGLVLALIGTTFLYRAGVGALGEGSRALSFESLVAAGLTLQPGRLVRIAFACGLVGYGAKVGLFPLHAWKSDAYSAAAPPAAGLLAGASVAASLLAVIRFALVARAAGEGPFVDGLLRAVGFASVLVATFFVVRERDLVRLFALTSIEQMGLCIAAFGLGPEGARAGVLQLFGNAILKTAAFALVGEVVRARGHASVDEGRGLFGTSSRLGGAFLLVTFAALGFPPFALFRSELLIFSTALATGHTLLAVGLVLCLCVAFAGVAISAVRAVFERVDDTAPHARLPASLAAVTAAALVVTTFTGSLMPNRVFDALDLVGRAAP